jgi:tetratricopeptide (TPR) repeat protein
MNYHNKEYYETELNRPIQSPGDFDWNSVYGLYLAGKSLIDQRMYAEAEEKINACLGKDKNYAPALTALSELEYRKLNYKTAFDAASKALAINTYDAAANYYYGLAALMLNKSFDAKDGFDMATQSAEYRVAAFTRLSCIYFKEKEYIKAEAFAKKSLIYNQYNMDALQLLAVLYRKMNNNAAYLEALKSISITDPLNHFIRFEKYFTEQTENNQVAFLSALQNEMPSETCMELATWYYRVGCIDEIKSLLGIAPDGPETKTWKQYFSIHENGKTKTTIYAAFPFREETAEMLKQLIQYDNDWQLKYYLGLIYQSRNNTEKARTLFVDCGNDPTDPSFYAVRAALMPGMTESDLKKAISLDNDQWRFCKLLAEHYLMQGQPEKALPLAENYYKQHRENYIVGMLYAKTLLLTKKYKECDELLSQLNIIPFEGATEGRQLYREAKLMQGVEAMQNKDYKKSLQFINEAKLWPENLGEGKPYEADIDERLENWMTYLCYQRTKKNKQAGAVLESIISFSSQTSNTPGTIFSANYLVTAWALEKKGQAAKASLWLEEQVKQHPLDKILIWVQEMIDKKQASSERINDATVRILKRLMETAE